MKSLVLIILCSCLFFGCTRKPMVIKYYPPISKEDLEIGHGALKEVDYRKPQGAVTIFGMSIF